MKYDLGSAGIISAIALPLLITFGLSDTCANEVWTVVAPMPGAILAWYARMKNGETDVLGRKA